MTVARAGPRQFSVSVEEDGCVVQTSARVGIRQCSKGIHHAKVVRSQASLYKAHTLLLTPHLIIGNSLCAESFTLFGMMQIAILVRQYNIFQRYNMLAQMSILPRIHTLAR